MLSIPAFAYIIIYQLVIAVLSLITYNQYSQMSTLQSYGGGRHNVNTFILALIIAVFIGLRPVSGRYFVDMANYHQYYWTFYDGATFYLDLETDNLVFDNLIAWWGSMRLGSTSFFFCIAVIYFVGAFLGIRRLFPNDTWAAFLVFLAAFSTFSYGTNGIKAGAAASLFIWAMGYRENLKMCIPLILLSWGFHHSMQLPVAAFILTIFFKNPKWYFYGWAACFLLSFAHVSYFSNIFASMTDESGAGYLAGGYDDGTKGGFRIDFILYSAMPVLVGYWALYKKHVEMSGLYKDLLNLYLCTNGVWMLCMYANFTNRIAYLSWFLYPIVLIYPFLNEDLGPRRYRQFSKVMLCHLAFTLFMVFVY